MKNIKIILGSVRSNRAGKAVADWVIDNIDMNNSEVKFELIDLKDINLPFMDEPVSPMASNNYVHEHTKNWSSIIDSADGFIFITPEYNQGLSPVLKNSIDFLYNEWKGKPAALVGYGGGGAVESIKQLRSVLNFVGLKPIDDQIGIGKIWEAFDENGSLKEDHIRGDLNELTKKLISAIA